MLKFECLLMYFHFICTYHHILLLPMVVFISKFHCMCNGWVKWTKQHMVKESKGELMITQECSCNYAFRTAVDQQEGGPPLLGNSKDGVALCFPDHKEALMQPIFTSSTKLK